MAAVAQVRHLDNLVERMRSTGTRNYAHLQEGWSDVSGRRRKIDAVIVALTRRTLPFEDSDLIAILEWCNEADRLSRIHLPLGNVVRALQRRASVGPLAAPLREAATRFASKLREAYDKDAKRLATTVEQLLGERKADTDEPKPERSHVRSIEPAPAGNPAVLTQLKRYLNLAVDVVDGATTEVVGLDRFTLRSDSPLRAEHELLSELFPEVIEKVGYNDPDLKRTKTGKIILAMQDAQRGRMFLAAAERDIAAIQAPLDLGEHRVWQSRSAASGAVVNIAQLPFVVDRDGAFDLLLFIGARGTSWQRAEFSAATSSLTDEIEKEVGRRTLSDGERYVLHVLRSSIIGGPPLGVTSPEVARLTQLIGDGANFYLVPGEIWTDELNADVDRLAVSSRRRWIDLFRHLLTANAARPTDKWLKNSASLVRAIGEAKVVESLISWLSKMSKGRSIRWTGASRWDKRTSADIMHEENATILKGILWTVPSLERKHELTQQIATVASSAYRKVPGVGPRAVKVGNAAVYALSKIGSKEAVGQLAMLKVRIKFGTAQKEIDKAFRVAAELLSLPQDEIEEMGVPSYGLEEVGLRRDSFGNDNTAELRVRGTDVAVTWLRSDGKPQKSVPAVVKSDHKEEWKELQQAAKDIEAMLPAQAQRIDSMFLLQKRWPVKDWRERYLDHPLVGTIARRLVWTFRKGPSEQFGIWGGKRLVNVDDEPLDVPSDAQVELWHPIGRPLDDVLAWRAWLDRHEVRQPFKQAHREVYLLTDAERRTATYSNRFAAHVLRQHQFNALCAARGWKNKLRLMVDDSFPPATRELPNWGLRAEYWVEGIGDDYGRDTNESGVYLRVATDQVRVYRTDAAANFAHAGSRRYTSAAAGPGVENVNEPLTLDQVPPLVFSEIMRDVDLFVGVASVGNDPTWQDGGPEGRYRTYWQNYSFGDLSATAQTRRSVLESLLPRLTKIRNRCQLSDRFLVVRGDIRTYKIHLGSGNILMEPNDQYLCIVPSRSTDGAAEVFLPFEGDPTLSFILSKAFLLTEDRKINDPTIARQIAQ